jgi:hypothetical protein
LSEDEDEISAIDYKCSLKDNKRGKRPPSRLWTAGKSITKMVPVEDCTWQFRNVVLFSLENELFCFASEFFHFTKLTAI